MLPEKTAQNLTATTFVALFLLGCLNVQAQVTIFSEDWNGLSGTYSDGQTVTGAAYWLHDSFSDEPAARLRIGFVPGDPAFNWGATLDMSPNVTNTHNALILTLDLSLYDTTLDTLTMDFDFVSHDDEGQSGMPADQKDSIYVRGSSSDPWVELYFWCQATTGDCVSKGTWSTIVLDGTGGTTTITNALISAGQEFSSTTQIMFSHWDGFAATGFSSGDGVSFDNIFVRCSGNCGAGIILNNSCDGTNPGFYQFDALPALTLSSNTSPIHASIPAWSYQKDNSGRLRTGSNSITSASDDSLTLDASGGTQSQNWLVLELEMTRYDATIDDVFLDFQWMNHSDENDLTDVVQVRGNNTGTWRTLITHAGDHEVNGVWFQRSDFNLAATLAAFGENFSATTQVRFGQADNSAATSTTGGDGISYDDVCVRAVEDQTVGNLSGLVYADDNNNGSFDGTDTGIPGVTVNLTGPGCAPCTAVTDLTGTWRFNNWPYQSYTVGVDTTTLPNVAVRTEPVSLPMPVTVATRTSTASDIGYTVASIGGIVFDDVDASGFQGAGENGIAGVRLELQHAGCTAGTDCPTQTTDATGAFDFIGLWPGNFTIDVVEETVGAGRVLTTANEPLAVVLAQEQDYDGAVFGYRAPFVFGGNSILIGQDPGGGANSELWVLDVDTGSHQRLMTSPYPRGLNSIGTFKGACKVLWSDTTSTYYWDPITGLNTLIADLAVAYPGIYLGGDQDRAGAAFWGPTNTYWLGAEKHPVTNSHMEALYQIVMNPTGTGIVSVTRVDLQAIAAADPETPVADLGGFGDMFAVDNGSGGALLYGSTRNLNTLIAYWWTYDTVSGAFNVISTGTSVRQLAASADGRMWAGWGNLVQEIDPATGNLLGTPRTLALGGIEDMSEVPCLLQIGAAKQVTAGPINNGDGTWSVTYRTRLETFGDLPLRDVQAVDDLTTEFGAYVPGIPAAPGQYTVSAGPAIVGVTGGALLTANPGFNGMADQNLLALTPGDVLPIGATADIDITVRFFPAAGKFLFYNQVVATGDSSEDGTADGHTDDYSDDGADPDPGDGLGGAPNNLPEDSDEGDPTIISIAPPYDLALIYEYVSDTSSDGNSTDGRAGLGDQVVYRVTMVNQSTTAATNVQVRAFVDPSRFDAFDVGLNPPGVTGGTAAIPYSWATSGNHGVATLSGSVPASAVVVFNAILTVGSAQSQCFDTFAEVYLDDGYDLDSQTELEEGDGNADVLVDNRIDNFGGDEDDHDGAALCITAGSIGDRVWHDADRDGFQDSGEDGIGGLTLRIYEDNGNSVLDGGDTLVGLTVTDANGLYRFSGLDATTYIVDPDESTLPAGYAATVGTGPNSAAITLTVNEDYEDADFGYAPGTSIIGDFVWFDTDADGIQDPGEVGISGVQITVTGPGPYSQTVTTGADGSWEATGLTITGDYQVEVDTATLPAGVGATPTNWLLAKVLFHVTAGIDYLQADFGFVGGSVASIGDTVWLDSNANGIKDAGEPGLGSVTVALRDAGANEIASRSTDSFGVYDFTGLQPGSYQVVVTDLNGLTDGLTLCFGTSPTALIPVLGGDDYNDADFGYCTDGAQGTIGNLVWNDLDGDGVFDSGVEPGLEQVSVELWHDVDGSCTLTAADVELRTAETDLDGRYEFQFVTVDQGYLVRVDPAEPQVGGMTLTAGAPTVDENSQPSPYCVQLTGVSPSNLTADFGYEATTSFDLCGTVFLDADASGVLGSDPEDQGKPFAVLTLYRDNDSDGAIDSGDGFMDDVLSDANGDYCFTGLPGGGTDWIISANVDSTQLNGFSQTTQIASSGIEPVEILAANIADLDFGYAPPPDLAVISGVQAWASDGVLVEWTTVSELGTLGFYLYRWQPQEGAWYQVNETMVSAATDAPLGARYSLRDPQAESGVAQEYLLVEVETLGQLRNHGPYVVVAEEPAAGYVDYFQVVANAIGPEHGRRGQDRGARKATAAARSEALRLKVSRAGVYEISEALLASSFSMPTDRVRHHLRNRHFALISGGNTISWWRAGAGDNGSSLRFFAPAPASLYSESAVYYLTLQPGTVAEVLEAGTEAVPTGISRSSIEFERNLFPGTAAARQSDQELWFWEPLMAGTPAEEFRFDFDLAHPSQTGTAILELNLFGATDSSMAQDHSLIVRVNDEIEGTLLWDGIGHQTMALEIEGENLMASGNELRLTARPVEDVAYSVVYLDSFSLTYDRFHRAATGLPEAFELLPLDSGPQTVAGFSTSELAVIDTTVTNSPVVLSNLTVDSQDGYRASFIASQGHRYFVYAESAVLVPTIEPASWPLGADISEGNYVILTPEELLEGAQRLADLRQQSGLDPVVVTLDSVFDRYSYGEPTPHAIRAFLADAWTDWQTKPRFAVLIGKGTVDYRNHRGFGDNLSPPDLTVTARGLYASDAPLGDVIGDSVPEIAVGRLPVLTVNELDAYIDKLIAYESSSRNDARALLISDDPDSAGNFPDDNRQLSELLTASVEVEHIDLEVSSVAEARQQIFDAFNRGATLVNYVGHGGLDRFAAEGLLLAADGRYLSAQGQLPIVTALTCAVNRFEVPGLTSLGESLVLDPDGGAIVVYAPTGESNAASALQLGEELLQAMMSDESATLGEAILEALRAYYDAGNLETQPQVYNLLGDPALPLPDLGTGAAVVFQDTFESGNLESWLPSR